MIFEIGFQSLNRKRIKRLKKLVWLFWIKISKLVIYSWNNMSKRRNLKANWRTRKRLKLQLTRKKSVKLSFRRIKKLVTSSILKVNLKEKLSYSRKSKRSITWWQRRIGSSKSASFKWQKKKVSSINLWGRKINRFKAYNQNWLKNLLTRLLLKGNYKS